MRPELESVWSGASRGVFLGSGLREMEGYNLVPAPPLKQPAPAARITPQQRERELPGQILRWLDKYPESTAYGVLLGVNDGKHNTRLLAVVSQCLESLRRHGKVTARAHGTWTRPAYTYRVAR